MGGATKYILSSITSPDEANCGWNWFSESKILKGLKCFFNYSLNAVQGI